MKMQGSRHSKRLGIRIAEKFNFSRETRVGKEELVQVSQNILSCSSYAPVYKQVYHFIVQLEFKILLCVCRV
jgi:hypothetical protein